MYVWINIEKPEDYDALLNVGPSSDLNFAAVYELKEVARKLKTTLRPRVRKLLIELSYVDKDYRSTFYHFYAKKGRQYRGNSVRIHLFGATVSFDADHLILSRPGHDNPSDDYFGFITLRPTYKFTVGRSVVRPDAIEGAAGLALMSSYRVHVLGHELLAVGFPWMEQHSDIAVCAHVACWSILRHYANQVRKYREFLTHDITRLAQAFDPGGLLPSLGLYVEHAERIFSEAGTYPLVISMPKDPTKQERKDFHRQLFAYLDSGFPLYVVIKDDPADHAVAAIGYRSNNSAVIPQTGIAYAADMIEALILSDDNHMPYRDLRWKTFPGQSYRLDDVIAFIAPLPDKVFLPAEHVENLVPYILNDLPLDELPDQDDLVLRYFVTTAALIHKQMREAPSQFDPELINEIMQLPMAQYVWVMEFARKKDWPNSHISGRAIIDATAGVYEEDALWAIYDRKTALLFDRRGGGDPKTLSLNTPASAPYAKMIPNLDPIRV